MSKSKKLVLRTIPVLLLVVVLAVSPVLGFSDFSDINEINNNLSDVKNSGNDSTTLNNTIGGIWKTIVTILQIAAVGAIIFAGVKYMFSNASDRANIKGQLIVLVIGAVLVFGASAVVQVLTSATNELTGVQ